MKRSAYSVVAAFLLLGAAVSVAQSTVNLLPGNGNRDNCWITRDFPGMTKTTYGIRGTGDPLSGYVTWNSFSGSTGRYKVELQAVLESDGNSPYKLYIAGSQVKSGNYPYADGSRDCSGSTYKVVWLNLGEHNVSQGDQIRYWAQSVYPCGSSHGQYSRFQELRFTRVTSDNTAPSVPTNLRSTAATNTSITLSWSASSDGESGINAYRIYIGSTLKETVGGSSTSGTITGLTRNTSYSNISVSAVNGAGMESAKSSSITASTADDPAPAGTIFIRAADGQLTNGMTIAYSGEVAGALAGNSIYGTTGDLSAPQTGDSKASYTINVSSSDAGTYYAWFRTQYEADNANSFWIQVDGGSAHRIVNGADYSGWHWEGHMTDGAVNIGNLSAGEHTITITAREPSPNSLLDVICLTKSSSYVPTDGDVSFYEFEPITLVSPVGGETYDVGDELRVQWRTSQVSEVNVYLSSDEGETWTKLNATGGSIGQTDDPAVWGDYPYVLQPGDASGMCMVKVEDYNQPSTYAVSPATFTVNNSSNVSSTAPHAGIHRAAFHARVTADGTAEINLPFAGLHELRVLNMQGSVVATHEGTGPQRVTLSRALPAGVFFIEAFSAGQRATTVLRITR
ncbi:MAG: hypothetical protein GF331_20295 [Chitinivibrionales bacterium]|nr:hypothetical protein [Chitinivibrionales bacterium]